MHYIIVLFVNHFNCVLCSLKHFKKGIYVNVHKIISYIVICTLLLIYIYIYINVYVCVLYTHTHTNKYVLDRYVYSYLLLFFYNYYYLEGVLVNIF